MWNGIKLCLVLFLMSSCQGIQVYKKKYDVLANLTGYFAFGQKQLQSMVTKYPFQNVNLPWSKRVADLVKLSLLKPIIHSSEADTMVFTEYVFCPFTKHLHFSALIYSNQE